MMEPASVTCRVDRFGRLLIPAKIRRALGIGARDPVEIWAEQGAVVLEKRRPSCVFCGGAEGLAELRGRAVCRGCLRLAASRAEA